MGWFDRAERVRASVADTSAQVTASTGTVYQFPTLIGGRESWSWSVPVSRADAESVPACARAVDLVASTVAGLPLQRFHADGSPAPLGWLTQPEAERTRFSTINALARDLIFDGDAWLANDAPDGSWAPLTWHYVPPSYVAVQYMQDAHRPWIFAEQVTISGSPPPPRLLRFRGWHDGIRNHGARVLRTALAWQSAAKERADSPMPQTTLKNVGNYEMAYDEVTTMLAGYKAARRDGATAYLNQGVDEIHNSWSSSELQLVEAQAWCAGQVCNLVGVPASFIAGASTSGASLTYSNVTLEMQALLSTGAVRSVLSALEAVLSSAVAAERPGDYVRFNLGSLLRGNPSEVAAMIATLAPLNVITSNEARVWLDVASTGGLA